eukprot:1186632-Pyramimonas_sp.AAC.1
MFEVIKRWDPSKCGIRSLLRKDLGTTQHTNDKPVSEDTPEDMPESTEELKAEELQAEEPQAEELDDKEFNGMDS